MSNKAGKRKYVVLFLAIVLFSGTLLFAFFSNIQEDLRLKGDIQKNILWGVSQGEPDLLRFLNTFQRFAYGDLSTSHDDLVTRFDVLWSRIEFLLKGPLGKELERIPKVSATAKKAMDILRRTEPQVMSIKRGEIDRYQKIYREYQELAKELHASSLNVSSYTNYKILEQRNHTRNLLKQSVILFTGVLLSGGLLIFLLIREIRISSRLLSVSDQAKDELWRQGERLQELVDARTATLLAAKKEAEEANRVKSEFLACMSHELRTPLNAVLGFAQLLQFDPKNPLSSAQNEHIECILSGGNHLLEFVNNVLDLAKIEADQISISLEDVSANKVTADCLDLTIPLSKAREINIIDRFSNGATVHIRTDRIRFKQVLLNLLSNAVKYNKDCGTIIVDGRETENGFVRISITDTGIGIAKKDYLNIFNMFHRLGADSFVAREGTGIGLTVTKLLVERMAGQVGFDSEEGVGSTFWIELPLASNDNAMVWTDAGSIGADTIAADTIAKDY